MPKEKFHLTKIVDAKRRIEKKIDVVFPEIYEEEGEEDVDGSTNLFFFEFIVLFVTAMIGTAVTGNISWVIACSIGAVIEALLLIFNNMRGIIYSIYDAFVNMFIRPQDRKKQRIAEQAIEEVKALETQLKHARGDPIVEETVERAVKEISAMLETSKGQKFLLRAANDRLKKMAAHQQMKIKDERESASEIEKEAKKKNAALVRSYIKSRQDEK